jgi:hypothetical protein
VDLGIDIKAWTLLRSGLHRTPVGAILPEMETVMAKPLEAEFDYYLRHQEDLVKRFNGKFIVIKDQKVVGSYDTEAEAIKEASKQHELGTFLVQKCEPGKDSYTQTFHSRVACV